MPGIQDLLALAQGGGAGGGRPQGAPPMPGGGGMPPGSGAALAQKLGELLQDPVAMRGMMQYAQQMGIDPQMIAQMVGGGQGGAPPMAAPPGNGQAGPPQGPQDMIPPGVPPMGDSPGAPMDEQQMINDEIDRKGATWDGQEAPTQNDIDRLQSDPSAINIKSFNAQFGEGAAEQVLGESGGGEEQGETSPDNESDEGDHEYR